MTLSDKIDRFVLRHHWWFTGFFVWCAVGNIAHGHAFWAAFDGALVVCYGWVIPTR